VIQREAKEKRQAAKDAKSKQLDILSRAQEALL
jgi:hypothetical protein